MKSKAKAISLSNHFRDFLEILQVYFNVANCLPPVSFGFAHRKVTDLLSKSTILGSPGALGGPEK